MAEELTTTEGSFTGMGVLSTYATKIYADNSDQIRVSVNDIVQTIGDDYVLHDVGSPGGVGVEATFTLGSTVHIEHIAPTAPFVRTSESDVLFQDAPTVDPLLLNPFETMQIAETVTIPSARKYVLIGARSANSERVAMDFRRVAAQPPHDASFRSADRFMPDDSTSEANGGWWELASPRVTPEMLADRPCGYRVGTNGFSAAPDDSVILNAAIKAAIHLDIALELHGKWYRHNSPLVAEPTRTMPYAGTSSDPLNLDFWAVINAQSFELRGFGNAGLIAGAAMQYQLRVFNDFSIPNSSEPQWCRIQGVKLNGNGLATDANLYLNWSGNAHIEDCGMRGSARSILCYGFGVFLIEHNDLNGSLTTIDVARGGDATIRDNDIFVQNVGVNAAGNIKIVDNIFTGTAFKNNDLARIGVLVNPIGGDLPYSYGMRICNNEFNSFDVGIYGDASGFGFSAIHMLTIASNQIIGDVNAQPDVTLCNFNNARNIAIFGNQICRDVQVVSQTPGIILTNVETSHIFDNDLTNIANSGIILTGCKDVTIHDNTLTNVSCIANLMAWSEALQTAPWTTTNAVIVTGTTNAIPTNTLFVPNGATLQRLQDNGTNGNHGIRQLRTVTAGQAYTVSVYVKAAELTKGKLCPHDATVGATFDLSTGTMTNVSAGCSAGIAPLGNGIFRVWCSINAMPDASASPGLYLINAAGAQSYAGTGQGMFAGAAGLVAGFAVPGYDGATGANGGGQPAQVVLTDSDHCNVHDNMVMVKYGMTLPTIFCAETGTSNANVARDNVMPADVISPFFRVARTSYLIGWEKSAFRVAKSVTQSVPAGTSTKITFDQNLLDRGGKFTSDRYAPGVGLVQLSGSLRVSGLVVGQAFEVMVMKNGVTAVGGCGRLAASTDDAISFSTWDEAAIGDSYEIWLFAAGAGTKTVSNDGRFSYFAGSTG